MDGTPIWPHTSRLVSCDESKKYIVAQAAFRPKDRSWLEPHGAGQNVPRSMDTSHVGNFGCNDVSQQPTVDKHVKQRKGQRFEGQCFHCYLYGHRLSECQQTDRDMIKTGGGETERHCRREDPCGRKPAASAAA